MKRPLDPRGLLDEIAIVECHCIVCGTVAEIGTGSVPNGQVPQCRECGNPMMVRKRVR